MKIRCQGKLRKRTEEWLQTLQKIPEGKALLITNKDTSLSIFTLEMHVRRFIKEGKLPKNYRVTHRKVGDTVTLYVVNSTESDVED